MKFRGGYNIFLQGRPDGAIKAMPEAKKLYLPLRSQRFVFSELCVENGQSVNYGDVLAKDPGNYAVPLLAPREGTVRLNAVENHIVLEDVAWLEEHAYVSREEPPHIVQEMGAAGLKRYKLLMLGAWQFFYDAYGGTLPDPLGTPQAIIVSTVSLEPFVARGDAQLHDRLLNFTRGLEQLQSLLEYQPIFLVMPDIESEFATLVRKQIRGYAWAKMLEIPLTYPYDNFVVLARKLGLKQGNGPVWAVRTEGVMAIDKTLTSEQPCVSRVISIGGPCVNKPVHIEAVPGYPLQLILDSYVSEPAARIINGGILTGTLIGEGTLGLDAECKGLTILPEPEDREFLGFARPGWGRRSYSGCFLSSLRGKFNERLTTAIRGEGRPCISCNFCEEVCPAGIIPYLIHKYLYQDLIEEADEARVDLCVECGLCSFVCPSKIELTNQFIEAKDMIEKEKEEIRKEEARQESVEEKIE
ncbi:MAG: 4Fe-4S dicluster domain-containing protein [Planctomycetota bacterium]|jgi:Na+-transporting NADH:ubiquinone oxidoreductase subunit A